jgi:hypothetical protein
MKTLPCLGYRTDYQPFIGILKERVVKLLYFNIPKFQNDYHLPEIILKFTDVFESDITPERSSVCHKRKDNILKLQPMGMI